MRNLILLIVFASTLAGCGKSQNKSGTTPFKADPLSGEKSNSTTTLSYSFEYNGCKTGKKTFESLASLCQGLQDNALNNHCASQMRERYFRTKCQGSFTAFSGMPEELSPPKRRTKNRDHMDGDTLIRTLKAGESTLVLFKNPLGDSESTLINCVPDAKFAEEFLNLPEMGGMMLTTGSRVILKNDVTNSFTNGKNLKGSFIVVKCR